jgi:hypothetical protein
MFEIVSSITTNRNISMCGLKIQNGCQHKTLFNIWTIWKYEWRFSQKLPYDHFVAISLLYMAGFTKLGKMGDFFSWFHWNRPIPAKRRHFCLRRSYKDCIFSPIIILFLQYSRKRSSHVSEFWPIQDLLSNILFKLGDLFCEM